MRKFIVSILGVILVIAICCDNIYMAIAKGISYESIHTNSSSGDFLSEFIYDDNGNKTDIFMTILRLSRLKEEDVIRLMENSTVDKYLTDIVNSIYDYNLTGDVSYKYTGSEIYSIVEDNIDSVMQDIDYSLSDGEIREIFRYMDNNMDYIINTIYGIDIGGYARK